MNDPFIVAEIGASHGGSIAEAFYLIDAAKYAGADAVKFQTYTPEEIAADAVIDGGPWAGRNYRDLYKQGATPLRWHESLFQYARGQGLIPFSSPFSERAVEQLEKIDCPIYKIASPEITHLGLIAAAAKTGKPLIISTGMASWQEIGRAWNAAVGNGCKSVTFLHCVSSYPAAEEDMLLCNISALIRCGYQAGLSDHSLSSDVAMMAVAMGAKVVEKHLTIDRSRGGLDDAFSLEPDEFAEMVRKCRAAKTIRGDKPQFGCRECEATSYQYRRSIWVVKPVKRGSLIKATDLAILRPNNGLDPSYFGVVVGKEAKIDIKPNTPLTHDHLK